MSGRESWANIHNLEPATALTDLRQRPSGVHTPNRAAGPKAPYSRFASKSAGGRRPGTKNASSSGSDRTGDSLSVRS